MGTADGVWTAMAIEKESGHFGDVSCEQDRQPWLFCNSSLAQFLDCFVASQRVWQLEEDQLIAWEKRGAFLKQEIDRTDSQVLADENNMWSALVEELIGGAI